MNSDDIILNGDFTGPETAPVQRIKVIGVGGGGNNAVNHMFDEGIKDVSFVQINTDRPTLDASPVKTKLVIGPGRGAGGKPERARQFAEDSAEQISELFDDHTDMVFVTAGMGGGTGTGAGPVVARIAKERGILTVGIVTIPFLFEGKKKVLKALEGADEMAANVDALLMINNERLNEIYSDLDIFNAFAKADDTLLYAAKGITEIITNTGVINRDFNDVDTTLREGGTAIISSGYGEGEQRVTKAIQEALHSPLLRNTDIYGSKKILIALYVSDDPEFPFKQSETRQINEFIECVDPDVEVMWGLYRSSELKEQVKITILASGFSRSIDNDEVPTNKAVNKESDAVDEARERKLKEVYGEGAEKFNAKPRSRILRPEELDSDTAIAETETAAFNRTRRVGTSVRASRPAQQPARKEERPATPSSDSMSIHFDDIDP